MEVTGTGDEMFYRLAPFLQEWVYASGWDALHPIQEAACDIIFNSTEHLLLSTGTASGKTEAALLPALTLVHDDPPASIGILYISPMKALINDQFYRAGEMLDAADIPVFRWHGDVARSKKQKLVKNPRGLLQITPESLEGMLINRSTDLKRLFGDLRFVIVDELHNFLSSERGIQVRCQLERLARETGHHPRRIGLSATLGDLGIAENWLAGDTRMGVATPLVEENERRFKVAVEHFNCHDYMDFIGDPVGTPTGIDNPVHVFLHQETLGKKCIVFSNAREDTEFQVFGMRSVAKTQGTPDVYHVHHGDIAGQERESVEASMREEPHPQVTGATMSMELGIDIGDVSRIINTGPPHAVSTFLQRLGRSGRRGVPPEIIYVTSKLPWTDKTPLPARLPWDLLQCIAVIQLHVEERWIEPARQDEYPVNLLYHQTMSILAASGELSPAALASQVLTLPPFKHVTTESFKILLRHLVAKDHVQQLEDGNLMIGLEGEKIVRNFRFYAVFRDFDIEWSVKAGSRDVGHLHSPKKPGTIFLLAGRVWEVDSLSRRHKVIHVKPVEKKAAVTWPGDRAPLHTKVLQRMKRALFEEETAYPYLQEGARARLAAGRELATDLGLKELQMIKTAPGKFTLFPWVGTSGFLVMRRAIEVLGPAEAGISRVYPAEGEFMRPPPFYISFTGPDMDPRDMLDVVSGLIQSASSAKQLIAPGEEFILERYHNHVPLPLVQEYVARDRFNHEEALDFAKGWKKWR